MPYFRKHPDEKYGTPKQPTLDATTVDGADGSGLAVDPQLPAAPPAADLPAATTAESRTPLTATNLLFRIFAGTALVVLLVLGLAIGVTLVCVQRAIRDADADSARALAQSVSHATGPLVSGGQLTELRGLVMEVGASSRLSAVMITLPDGSVVAHSDPQRISVKQLPATWSSLTGTNDAAEPPKPGEASEIASIPGRGSLIVTVIPASADRSGLAEDLVILTGAVALLGMVLLALLLRGVARPLSTLGLIARALADFRLVGPDAGLLQLDRRFGPLAEEFNRLLELAQRANALATPADNSPSAQPLDPDADPRDASRGLTRSGEFVSDLEQAVNVIPTGLMIVDRSGVVRHANNMGAILAGSSATELPGRNLTDVLSDPAITDLVESIREGRITRRAVEVRRSTANAPVTQPQSASAPTGSEAVLRVQCRPLRRDDGGAALITLEDITQQRLADASRGLFVAQATHELRTPLTNMRLALETVVEEGETLPPDLVPHVNLISSEVRRLERIVGDMLAVSEIEAGSLKLSRGPVQLERLLGEIEQDHRGHAEESGLAFQVVLPPKYPQLYGDREKLAQVLHNLVGNAIKYTAPGGRVTLSVSESADAKHLVFTVTDTGFGISPDDQQRLFSRFARGSDPRVSKIVGTGLGLALSREIARLHGGDITLTSELNKGSTFTLVVPLGRSEQRMAA